MIWFFSVKYAFEKCAQKSVTESNDNCAEKKQLTGYNQMFAHLYRVEVMTKCYLCTLKTTLNDEFKNEFVCDTKEMYDFIWMITIFTILIQAIHC